MRIIAAVLFIALMGAGLGQAATVTLYGAAGNSCSYSLIQVGPLGNIGVTCAATLTVVPPVVAPPPPPPPATPPPQGCAGTTLSSAFTMNAEKMVFTLARGQTAGISFTPQQGQRLQLSTTDTTGTPQDASHTVTVSECQGDFVRPWPCSFSANFVGSTLNVAGGDPAAPWACRAQPGRTYYMNVRMDACDGACPVRVQIQGYQ